MVKRARRSAPRRRRFVRRVRTVSRVPRSMGGGSHFSLKQKTFSGVWNYDPGSTAGFWQYWTASPVAMYGWAEHSAVFDEYKVNALLFEFMPNFDSFGAELTTSATFEFGQFHTSVDPSSTMVPSGVQGIATLNEFLQQGDNVKSGPINKVRRVYYKPKVATAVMGGGIGGRLIKAPWLKTTDNSVNHRGFHSYIYPNYTPSNSMILSYNVYITYFMQFRGSR